RAAEGDFEAFMKSLPSLPTGEGWIWSPEFLGKFERIKIRERETFHPDREAIGDTFVMPELDQVDVQHFIKRFSKKEKPQTQPSKQSASYIEEPRAIHSHPGLQALLKVNLRLATTSY